MEERMSRPDFLCQSFGNRGIRPGKDQAREDFAGVHLCPSQQDLDMMGKRVDDLGLRFSQKELTVIAGLKTPELVQAFLDTQIGYNNDHGSADIEETAMSPKMVLARGTAHCFEGAMFAYAVNFLHGHRPLMMLLEASQDSEHNVVVYRDRKTYHYGSNAHSAFPGLNGRPAVFTTVDDLAKSYESHYYSDRTNCPKDLTLVGYSNPFDLRPRHGVEWMASTESIWPVYFTYINDTVRFHYLYGDNYLDGYNGRTHDYPLIKALKEGWIKVELGDRSRVCPENLPEKAKYYWKTFWQFYNKTDPVPINYALALERQFRYLTGTTPIDLIENANDMTSFLKAGFKTGDIITLNG